MAEQKKVNQPTVEAKESLESINRRLAEDNDRLRKLAEKTVNENQILRAALKAVTQLI